jgi:hypothetical protein
MAVVSLQIQPGEAAGDRLPSESGNPSASAGHGFPGMTISGTATKFREFAAGGVLLCADWVKIRDSRRRRLR